MEKAVSDWYVNAGKIAGFLSAANPNNWPASAAKPALEMHIAHTIDYALNILKGEYNEPLTAFEKALNHMLSLADILSEDIAREFSDEI